ncbi:hypothetical protein L6452_41144 [Arctium lappa]|uniref:Uncharacterized protein n=1 Tax=Arctium lappa TaxID=4217 RepID=A0ACB8XNH0_ARCLA|nr:hypothetical protein L6452_41144 [Arctium lappa]
MEGQIVSKEVSSRTNNPMDDNDDRGSCFRATTMNIDGELMISFPWSFPPIEMKSEFVPPSLSNNQTRSFLIPPSPAAHFGYAAINNFLLQTNNTNENSAIQGFLTWAFLHIFLKWIAESPSISKHNGPSTNIIHYLKLYISCLVKKTREAL